MAAWFGAEMVRNFVLRNLQTSLVIMNDWPEDNILESVGVVDSFEVVDFPRFNLCVVFIGVRPVVGAFYGMRAEVSRQYQFTLSYAEAVGDLWRMWMQGEFPDDFGDVFLRPDWRERREIGSRLIEVGNAVKASFAALRQSSLSEASFFGETADRPTIH